MEKCKDTWKDQNFGYCQYTFKFFKCSWIVLWGKFHSLDLNQCVGGLGRFLSKELNQGSWDFNSLFLPTKEITESKGVWATLKKKKKRRKLHLEICKKKKNHLEISWKSHGILSLRKSGNPDSSFHPLHLWQLNSWFHTIMAWCVTRFFL